METSLATTTNGTKSVMSVIKTQIDDAIKSKANLLLPVQILSDIPAMHNVTIEHVTLSTKIEDGDIYPKQGDDTKFILTKQGIMKLCACAGVEWNWQFCGRTDRGNDPDYISYKMVGALRKLDGSWMSLQGEYDMDFQVLEDDLREQYKSKCKAWNKSQAEKDGYVESNTRKELLRMRRYKMGRVETGAMLRALRGLLTLKNSYTKAELEKPFVIARLAFQPDFNDPSIRKEFVAASVNAIHGVFGPSQNSAFKGQPLNTTPEPVYPEEKIYDVEPEPEPEPESAPLPTEDMPPSDEVDFLNCEDAEQVRILKELGKKSGVPISEIRFSEQHKPKRLELFKFLKSKIEPEKPITIPDDDIPW